MMPKQASPSLKGAWEEAEDGSTAIDAKSDYLGANAVALHTSAITVPLVTWRCNKFCYKDKTCALAYDEKGRVWGMIHWRAIPFLWHIETGRVYQLPCDGEAPGTPDYQDLVPPPFPGAGHPPTVWGVSPGRSRTRWMARMLSLSPDATVVHEPPPHPWQWPDTTDPLSAPLRQRHIYNCATPLYGEMSLHLAPYVQTILEHTDKAKAIHLHRHPRDVVRSMLQLDIYREGDTVRIHKPWNPDPDDPDYAEFQQLDRRQRCLWWWSKVTRAGLELERAQPERTRRVGFNELFDLDVVMGLFDWLGIERPTEELATALMGERVHHRDNLKESLEWQSEWDADLPTELMAELGYEA